MSYLTGSLDQRVYRSTTYAFWRIVFEAFIGSGTKPKPSSFTAILPVSKDGVEPSLSSL